VVHGGGGESVARTDGAYGGIAGGWRLGLEGPAIRNRRARDATLAPPLLVLPNLQVNIAAAELPPADAKGHRFLRLPLQGV
jgi:hypothetical protein